MKRFNLSEWAITHTALVLFMILLIGGAGEPRLQLLLLGRHPPAGVVVVHEGVEHRIRHGAMGGLEHVPKAGLGAAVDQRRPVVDLEVDVEAGILQLLREHQDQPDHGLVVYVDMTIHEDDFGRSKIDVQDNFNVSLIGVGTEGEFDGVGFTVRRAHNIVFRNLALHHVSQGEGTAIEVTDDSSNVWIDHNEFYSELDGNDDSDYYDGLVDIKRNAEYITVSWNYLHDHWKTGLIGHNDNADLAADNITFHHNWYSNLNSRTPLTRFADVHMLNNYFEDIHDTAINSRMGAQILVEGNYFLRTGSGQEDGETGHIKGPVGWFYGSPETGFWNLVDNIFEDSPSDHLESTTDFTVPYDYSADAPEDVPDLVQANAGVGVLDVTTPKLPPPPCSAQKSPGFSSSLAWTTTPSAVTSSAASRLSQARPILRASQPSPPPSVNPPTPVVETRPPVVASP
jgi:pectate lyase